MGQSWALGNLCIAHVKECIQKTQSLKYAEEVYHNGTLVIKAFSSGLEIGASNWVINGPKRNFTWLSSSIFASRHAMGFDYNSLQGNGVILFSDFSSMCGNVSVGINAYRSMNQIRPKVNSPTGSDFSTLRDGNNSKEDFIKSVTDTGENTVEIDKLAFICSCAIDSVREGGSVLIPIGRLGIILQLLEQISISLESSNLNVPMFIISDVAEEILSLMNVVPEWLCEQRQQKLYSGEALFGHVKLIKEKKLHLFHTIHSPNLLAIWKEPCIVFSPHWSLRQGPAIHLLRRWSADKRCLLVLEQGVDADIALLPFKPIAMKVLQCSFLSGIEMQKIQPLLEILRPKLILFPEDLMAHMITSHTGSSVYFGYSENETICVPRSRDEFEVDLATDLVFQLQPRRIKQENAAIARLKGKYHVHHGRHLLISENEPVNHSQSRLLLQWGSLDLTLLLLALREKGINGSIDNDGMGEHNSCFLRIYEPKKALIETTGTLTVVSAVDETLASIIFQTICSVLDAI
uniref:Beta-Casp domain-containing protein n=1 Tax=Nelumbo nucifera TaxID=4432 RepID=A0A822ZEW0_NELNU|nr:TPA_asm: hypothetical protein HUJ06_001333 [Nelumbo nucifera]